MIENGFMENPQFRNDGKGDFSTSERGDQVSTYGKPVLIQLAKAVTFVDLPTDLASTATGVIPTRQEKTQEGDKLYRLWFVVDSTGSVYSAFCRCQGEADQGCRH
ncbi:hypothetical protein pdam_00007620 [Pocillopora damicornis]|uniref:SWIM-type domain-containing protein n=1 Tax=Pocillopora damicornis TaxID=46731 RepID=A0A3M6TZL3_POCDA|nr:hypothetical protein pdam_00007620 [Pocillopora damicornis]